ncbi:MAG: hypothetical protein JOZ07_13900 [Solirubrobacterales bacterium]|nr:hypothetical protein [Solirubrobacterales bacterium]
MRRGPIAITAALALVGCGASSPRRHPDGASLPLVAGARVFARARSCDRGVNAYCALQVVVIGPRYADARALLAAEAHHLRALGWTSTVGDTPQQRSADSPGHRLRLTYTVAFEDLESWDEGYLARRRQIARALAATLFARTPALSMMLVSGPT